MNHSVQLPAPLGAIQGKPVLLKREGPMASPLHSLPATQHQERLCDSRRAGPAQGADNSIFTGHMLMSMSYSSFHLLPRSSCLWMGSSLTSSTILWGKGRDKCRADTGHGLLNTWVPLDNTGSWGGGCVPSLSLPVTHWTPLAENLVGRKDKKGRKLFPCAYPWNCSQLWLPPPPSPIHWTWGFPTAHLPPVL